MASIYDLQTSELEKLLANKKLYTTGTEQDKKTASTANTALRNQYGITSDTASSADLESVIAARNAQQAQASQQATSEQRIADLAAAQKQKAMAELGAVKESALQSLNAEKSTIAPTYQANRNEIASEASAQAKRLAELMAKSKLEGAGASAQMQQIGMGNLQSNLASSNTAESNALADVARRQSLAESAYQTGLQSSNASADIANIQNLINQANTNRTTALQEAGITGMYGGQQTQSAKESAINQANQQAAYNESVRQFNLQQQQQQKSFDEGVRQFNANMDFNTKQWIASNALDLRQQTFAEAQAAIQNALSRGQLSVSQGNNALAWAKFNADQDPTSLDNQIKSAQLSGLQAENTQIGQQTTKEFNPALLNDPSYSALVNSAKSTNEAERTLYKKMLTDKEAQLVNDYGQAGYKALVDAFNSSK